MKNIKLIIIDVDGTLTDGKINIDSNGNEFKSFYVKDGLAIDLAIKANLKIIFLSGRHSVSTEIRARELGVQEFYSGICNKAPKVLELSEKYDIKLKDIAYIGDDLNDFTVMKMVGLPLCPADACQEVKEVSNKVSRYNGGRGAVRDFLEMILKDHDKWSIIPSNEYKQ